MKKFLSVVLALSMTVSLVACGNSEKATETSASTETSISEIPFTISEDPVVVSTEETEEEEEVVPENSYRSELTNEWISNDIKDQRPVAVMVDNESVALPHYGTSQADIIYEMMNSTENGRITRFMCIIKDWQNVEQIGNIRSTRPTNCYTFNEYNAILVHDGGPYYINDWLTNYPNATDHLSSGFARIDRGKASYYEEYATNEHYSGVGEYSGNTYSSLLERIESAGYDLEYNEYYNGPHFQFSDTEFSLKDESDAVSAKTIETNFTHNSSMLTYDEDNGVYVYSEYGKEYKDALTDTSLTFKNLIIYADSFFEYDENGYFCYDMGGTNYGYYCTDGYAVPIRWEKKNQESYTHFYRLSDDTEITLNTGKTYIAICPLDTFESDFVIK